VGADISEQDKHFKRGGKIRRSIGSQSYHAIISGINRLRYKHMKTIVITGANSGIGLATVEILASQQHKIITICRRSSEGDRLVKEIKQRFPQTVIENFTADLSDLSQVNDVANKIAAAHPVIDRLINNAGYYPAKIEYVEGIEKSFLASHLGHVLLTQLLMPSLVRSAEARIINVSSDLHKGGRPERFFQQPADHDPGKAYADDKLANILFSMWLAKNLPSNVTAYSLHPGVVRTNFGNNISGFFKIAITVFRPFFITPEQGAATTVYLAEGSREEITPNSGKYFAKKKPVEPSAQATTENADRLMKASLEKLKSYLGQPAVR
jgi:retinol dehydrogenase-12